MWENWEKLLNEIVIIKWAVICIAVSMWGTTVYFFLKEVTMGRGRDKPKREKKKPKKEKKKKRKK